MPHSPLVSVIIPTRNRAHLLEESVHSVLGGCAGADAEIIYVNDGSTDGTQAILDSFAPRIRSVQANARAPGRARNAGAAIAEGRWLLFTDDDCVLPANWAHDMVALIEHHGVDALTGGFYPMMMETPAERYYEYRMQTIFGDEAKTVGAAPMMNFIMDGKAFAAVGGFSDLRLSSLEDWHFCYRLLDNGYTLYYDPRVRVGHHYYRTWKQVRNRVLDTAWLAPLVWRESGVNPYGKLARDLVRCAASPIWCLRYFPLDLYPQAVGLEMAYFGYRLSSVVAGALSGGGIYSRYRPST